MKERVQKIIAERGVCSRRAAEKLIAEGRVKVNGRRIILGTSCDTKNDLITIDGKRIAGKRQKDVYLLVYKPRGYVTTAADDRGRKTVMELVKDVAERVYPVGRLDMASEGLLLLTNDGEVARVLTHPSCGVEKEYHVTVLGDVEKAVPLFEAGMTLDDGFRTAPARVRILKLIDEKTVLSLVITQGHNRQIRKMCEAAGLTVRRLVRVAEGRIKLGDLKPGECRPATKKEIEYLQGLAEKAALAGREDA